MAEVNTSRWNTIYPAYLNSNRTVAEGRRISKKKACADPCWQEIRDVLESIGSFEVVGEGNKTYPREVDKETPAHRGRVRYHAIKEHDRLKNKKDILIYLADMIPRLKSRTQKGAAHTQAADPNVGAAGKKKKGKK
jgi:signal recognition particle subunit SRP19